MSRYQRLDDIRGITLVSMILFHTTWDLVYLFGVKWDWFDSTGAYVWQQSICWTFIALSGFCWSLGKRKLRRGLIVLGAGTIISLVTEFLMPNQRIRFGILTFLGVAMLLLIPLEAWLKKLSPRVGLLLSSLCFFLVYGINDEYIGVGQWLTIWNLPKEWYQLGDLATFIGLTDRFFYSADYFSLFPWIFMFLTGFFLYRVAEEGKGLIKLAEQKSWGIFWSFLGRNSLIIYMLHQPVVYAVLWILHTIIA